MTVTTTDPTQEACGTSPTQPCDLCARPVPVHAISPSECFCSSECYEWSMGFALWEPGSFSLFDPEPDNHHSPLYLVLPDGLAVNISGTDRPGLDIARGRWMVEALNAALTDGAAMRPPVIEGENSRDEQLLQAQSEAARWRALLGKVFDSRAPDYVDQAYPGWSTEARSALSTQTQGGGENG